MIQMQRFHMPRCLCTSIAPLELHGFAAASDLAYLAVVYSKIKLTTLIGPKTKVVPIKPITIPRKELLAASLLVKLLKHVERPL